MKLNQQYINFYENINIIKNEYHLNIYLKTSPVLLYYEENLIVYKFYLIHKIHLIFNFNILKILFQYFKILIINLMIKVVIKVMGIQYK